MSRNSENIALFDMDGTLVDYEGQLLRDLKSIESPTDPLIASVENIHSDDLPEFFYNRINMIRKVPGWWKNLPRLELGFGILEIAQRIGFGINILTKGPSSNPNAWKEKVEWVREHLGDVKITITKEEDFVYGKVLVDDYMAYMKRWLQWRPRGLGIMPIDTRYYQRFTEEQGHEIPENVLQFAGVSDLKPVSEALQAAYDR